MIQIQKSFSTLKLSALVLLGVSIRLALPWVRHNFDVDSWNIVADLLREGKNVYAETWRHVYGPGLFPICWFSKTVSLMLPFKHPESFHFIFVCFLILADLGIFFLLRKKVSSLAAILFFLSPISILITSVHSQIDNLAIFFGFGAWLLYETPNRNSKTLFFSAALLGLSLIIKHDFILLPLWLLFDPRWTNRKEKMIYLFMVYALFAGSFVPFCESPESRHAIIKNVFQYSMGTGNALLTHLTQVLIPIGIIDKFALNSKVVRYIFIWLMLLFGRFVMKRDPQNAFYLYLVGIVLFSPQMADQYLAIPVLTCAVFSKNRWLIIYTAVSTFFILGSPFNLYLWPALTGWTFLTSTYGGGLFWYYNCQIWLLFFLIAYYFQLRSPNCNSPSQKLC